MKIIMPSGYRKIYWGLLAGAALTLAYLSARILPLGEQSPILMALAVFFRAGELLASIFVINGLIESGRESVAMNRAKIWMTVRLVINALFTRASTGLYHSVSNIDNLSVIDYIQVVVAFGGLIAGILAYSNILTGFSQVWDMCGDEKEMRRMLRLRRSLIASSLLLYGFMLYLIIIVLFSINTPFYSCSFLAALIFLVWRGIIQVMIISESRKTAVILTEISK